MAENHQSISGLNVYKRLLGYSMLYWKHLLAGVLSLALFSALSSLFPKIVQPLIDGSFVNKDPQTIKWMPIFIILIFTFRSIASYIGLYCIGNVGARVVERVREDMFSKLQFFPVAKFDSTTSGELLSQFTFNVERITSAATKSITILIRDFFLIVFLLAVMLQFSWKITLAFLLLAPVLTGVVSYASKKFRSTSHKIQASIGKISHIVEESISGHKIIKIFNGQKYEIEKFINANKRNRRNQQKMVATKAATTPTVQLIVGYALAAIIFFATQPSVLSEITVGGFMGLITAMTMLLEPARRLTEVNETLQMGIAAGESVFKLIDEHKEVDKGHEVLADCKGRVDYKNVGFKYSSREQHALSNINFVVQPGETLALVGRSGSGKTSIVHLLTRFYDFSTGQILIDGKDIRNFSLDSVRSQIAFVGQDTILFNDTIANNIAYAKDLEPTDSKIIQAAKAAHALEFIEKLPQGMNTLIGENGVLLSGGQRQRIAIARALLKDAPILILDEATSSLDSESEAHIQAALDKLKENRTTLIIAHRLSTVEKASHIVVLDAGKVVESGAHTDLLAKNGAYTNLYKMQLREPEVAVNA